MGEEIINLETWTWNKNSIQARLRNPKARVGWADYVRLASALCGAGGQLLGEGQDNWSLM